MPDTKVRSWKATDQLKEDHVIVRELFRQYEVSPGHVSKYKLFQKIKEELTAHAETEAAVFYPAIDRLEIAGVQDVVSEAHEEHEIVKVLLAQLSGMTPEDFYFDAKMKVLFDNVTHHAAEEEAEIFPLFKKLDKEEQERVSDQLRAKRDEITGYISGE